MGSFPYFPFLLPECIAYDSMDNPSKLAEDGFAYNAHKIKCLSVFKVIISCSYKSSDELALSHWFSNNKISAEKFLFYTFCQAEGVGVVRELK